MSSEIDPTSGPTETAGVVARPPAIYAGFLVLGLVLDRVGPLDLPMPASLYRWAVGACLVAMGAGFVGWAFHRFIGAGTNVPTWKPTLAIVTDGPYRYSRNPIYVGLTAIYLGIALAAASSWAFAMLVPVLATMQYGVILREERYMERLFGQVYRDYKSRVRRWL